MVRGGRCDQAPAAWPLKLPSCAASQSELHPHLDTGDFVVVVDAEKIKVMATSLSKVYRHQRAPRWNEVETFEALQERIPERIVGKAIHAPPQRLGRQMFHQLKVYKGTEHPSRQAPCSSTSLANEQQLVL